MTIRILIADDDPIVREAFRELIETDESFEVVALAGDANEAMHMAGQFHPDLALVDVRMPGGGAVAAHGVHEQSPRTRIVAFSAYEERWAILEMVRAGAIGYLVKGTPSQELLASLRDLAAGRAQLAPAAAGQIIDELATRLRLSEQRSSEQARRRERIERVLDDPASIQIHLQPIFELATGRIEGMEALARFPTVDEIDLGPAQWFSEAWAVGLGVELELVAVRNAVACFADLPPGVWLAINVSPGTMLDPRLVTSLPEDLRRIVLEVTEHAPIGDYEQLAATLLPLRQRGASLAVDDAGAGFASLRHILQLAPDHVKLDGSLTHGIDRNGPQRTLAVGLLRFADELQAAVIAEGIETAEERDILIELGVRYGQGYFLARPELPERLRATSQPDPVSGGPSERG